MAVNRKTVVVSVAKEIAQNCTALKNTKIRDSFQVKECTYTKLYNTLAGYLEREKNGKKIKCQDRIEKMEKGT